MAGFTRYCVENPEDYENLYRRLTGQPKTKKPDLGKLKSLGERMPKTNFFADTGGGSSEGSGDGNEGGGDSSKDGGGDGDEAGEGGGEGSKDGGGDGGGGEERSSGIGRDVIRKSLEKGAWIAMILWVIFEVSGRALNSKFLCGVIVVVLLLGIAVFGSSMRLKGQLKTLSRSILDAGKRAVNRTLQKQAMVGIVRLGVLFMGALALTVMLVTEASGLVAVVEHVHWKDPNAVANELTTIDVRDWCSMYNIGVSTNNSKGVKEASLMIPDAKYIEVTKNNRTTVYENQEIATLPGLASGEQIDIKAWATCKAKRQNAKRVRVTHMGGRPAELDVRNPVTALAQLANQHTKVAWICVGVAIYGVLAVVKKLFG